MGTLAAKVTRWAFVLLILSGCTQKGNILYLPDPEEPRISTAPLVTVIYDPFALGDRSYNDLIYQGVEEAAARHGLRTMQQSPQSYEEGQAYLQTMFEAVRQSRQDTVRRLYIVAATGYDSYLRANSHVFDEVPSADLLYLETPRPLESKGSTLHLPYYGAMYEAGALLPAFSSSAFLIVSNPEDQTVREAADGIADGYASQYFEAPERELKRHYLSDKAGTGYSISDTTALQLLKMAEGLKDPCLIPLCGGAGHLICYLAELLTPYSHMGIDMEKNSPNCQISVLKHIDRAVALYIDQWLSPEGMPKHLSLGLASGYTEAVIPPLATVSASLRDRIHQDAIQKEEAYGK